jgi:hypothetical protein
MNATGKQLSCDILSENFTRGDTRFHALSGRLALVPAAWHARGHRSKFELHQSGSPAARYFSFKRKRVPQGCFSGNYAKVIKAGSPAANDFRQPRRQGRNSMRETPQQQPGGSRRAALPVLVLVALGWAAATIFPVPDAEARGPGSWQPYHTWRVKGGSPAARYFLLKRKRVPKSSYYQTGIGEKAIKGGSPATSVFRH